MAIITKPYSTANGTTADGAKVSANFDALFSDYNGNVTDANIAASGITTYGKVNGTAITGLGSVSAGAGALPAVNVGAGITEAQQTLADNTTNDVSITKHGYAPKLPNDATKFLNGVGAFAVPGSSIKVGNITRAMNATSGSVAYTGVGFTPKLVLFMWRTEPDSTGILGVGADDGTGKTCATTYPTGKSTSSASSSIESIESAGTSQVANIASFDADGFTLAWTKSGSPSSNTVYIGYIAFK